MKKLFLLPVLFILVLVTGCQQNDMINSPVDNNNKTNVTVEKAKWQVSAEKQGLNFIKVALNSEKNTNLEKLVTCTKYATVRNGAYLKLQYRAFTFTGITTTDVSLQVLPYALSQDQYLTMSFDGEYMMTDVNLTFGPHGTVFQKPALLNVFAYGLDLSGYPKGEREAYLWYYNEISDSWERMDADKVYINADLGILVCVNGYLPHFSRYGFTTAPETDING